MDDLSLAAGAGLVGVCLYVAAYAAMQFGFVRGQTYAYAGLNLVAASCVLLSLTETWNLSSALIQLMWIVISVVGMARLWYVDKALRFTAEEARILDALAPGLPKDQGRRLLDLGRWERLPAGTTVIEEGGAAEMLCWLGEGILTVSKGGRALMPLEPGAVIGEITYLDGAPASARIEVSEEARLFRLDAAPLRSLVAREDAIANALERSVARTLRKKLRDTSRELHDATALGSA